MPIFLNTVGDELHVSCGELSSAEFTDYIERVRSIPGRRYNPETKRNEFPRDADTALEIMQRLEPVADAAAQALVQEHSAQIAEELLTKLPSVGRPEWLVYGTKLRHYQADAVAWMAHRPKTILADEMGIGKTFEAIAAAAEIMARRSIGDPLLIVSPNAVRGTWDDELQKWAGLDPWDIQVIDGKTPAKRREQVADPEPFAFIVNWEKLRLVPELAKRRWGAVIADEAHRAKNKDAQQTKALWKLVAPIQFALTGTPVMNNPADIWSLLRWMYPDQFAQHNPGGGYWPFYHSYVNDYDTKHGAVVIGVKNADKLRFLLSDKLVRRLKRDVMRDLPEKLPTQIIPVELTPQERKLYEEVESAVFFDIKAYSEAQAERDIGYQEQSESTSGYEAEVAAQAERIASELSDMPLSKLQGVLPNTGARIAKLRQITAAAKVRYAEQLIREEPETPVVAFTWHVEPARELAERLRKGKPELRVGEIAGNDKPDPVKDAFQAGDLDHVVATIAKGGTGLTLTRSSNPMLVEEDWVPAINDQAIDRTHRDGQTEAVTPRALRVPGTVDDGRIAPKLRVKRMMAAQALGDPIG